MIASTIVSFLYIYILSYSLRTLFYRFSLLHHCVKVLSFWIFLFFFENWTSLELRWDRLFSMSTPSRSFFSNPPSMWYRYFQTNFVWINNNNFPETLNTQSPHYLARLDSNPSILSFYLSIPLGAITVPRAMETSPSARPRRFQRFTLSFKTNIYRGNKVELGSRENIPIYIWIETEESAFFSSLPLFLWSSEW